MFHIQRKWCGKKAKPNENPPPPPNLPIVYRNLFRLSDETPRATDTIIDPNAQANDSQFHMRGSVQGPIEVYASLSDVPAVRDAINNFGFSHLFSEIYPNSDNQMTGALISRWSERTHTFQLPSVELGITPFDFFHLTGNLSISCYALYLC